MEASFVEGFGFSRLTKVAGTWNVPGVAHSQSSHCRLTGQYCSVTKISPINRRPPRQPANSATKRHFSDMMRGAQRVLSSFRGCLERSQTTTIFSHGLRRHPCRNSYCAAGAVKGRRYPHLSDAPADPPNAAGQLPDRRANGGLQIVGQRAGGASDPAP
jgi:hypothetical protein